MTFLYKKTQGYQHKKSTLRLTAKGAYIFSDERCYLCESWLQFIGQGNHFLDAIFRQVTFLEFSEYFR
ncbi:UNVERIFIED_ORG: hypothetical protein DFS12_108141 [Chitinophaga ginsengisegetis]